MEVRYQQKILTWIIDSNHIAQLLHGLFHSIDFCKSILTSFRSSVKTISRKKFWPCNQNRSIHHEFLVFYVFLKFIANHQEIFHPLYYIAWMAYMPSIVSEIYKNIKIFFKLFILSVFFDCDDFCGIWNLIYIRRVFKCHLNHQIWKSISGIENLLERLRRILIFL